MADRLILTTPLVTDEEWESCNDYFSKSRLGEFKFCELKFKKHYIDKTLKTEPNHQMTVGSRFHEFAEIFYDIAKDYDPSEWLSFIHKDYSTEEKKLLTNFINREIDRYKLLEKTPYWMPLAFEYKIINHDLKLRGIIDKIEQINNDTIAIVEYKTGESVRKESLQGEFGFYEILMEAVPEFKNMKRLYYVYNPRLDEIHYFTPSRRSTILNRLKKVYDAIENNTYNPGCTPNYHRNCNVCTDEELLEYGIGNCCNG